MLRFFLSALAGMCIGVNAMAQGPTALNDEELSGVAGGDGIAIAVHLSLNNSAPTSTPINSRITMGFNVDGRDTYLVIRNPKGTIDMFDLKLSIQKKPDGSDYVAIGLPGYVKYTDWGFESFSAQTDPTGPVTESLGRLNLNGTMSMQGQFRMWAH